MLFPFSQIRPVQENFLKDVKYAVENSTHLMAHAPSGLGKTAASLSPALEYALDNGKTVLFLTSRHSQHAIAIETLKKVKEKHGVDFRVADIIGKKWLCNISGVEDLTTSEFNDFCNSLVREERCRFYNETRTAEKLLTKKAGSFIKILDNKFYHAEEIKDLSKDFCPYEIAADIARKSSVIIADYYHIFSPARNALLLRIRKELNEIILIVDEAHNLPQRIRDLMSQKLSSFSISKAEKEAGLFGFSDVAGIMNDMQRILDGMKRSLLAAEREKFISREMLIDAIENKLGKIDAVIDLLYSAGEQIREERKKSFIASVARFLGSWLSSSPGYARILRKGRTKSGRPFVSVVYKCLDPMVLSRDIFDDAYSAMLMSGTLLPLAMYRDILGLDANRTMMKNYPSPFPGKNRLNIVIRETTTKFSRRTDENFSLIAEYVAECSSAIPGNCAVFFPSYEIRDKIFAMVSGKTGKKILLEKKDSNKKERKELYNAFAGYAQQGALLLGVSAGSFSEGIDLPGMLLNGVIIVGIPLERPSLESKALIDYYDLRFSRGWDYGYIYPAMNRCLQAAGRAIRSESDRAVCIFIDERFLWSNYRKAFPSDIEMKITNEPAEMIKQFWDSK